MFIAHQSPPFAPATLMCGGGFFQFRIQVNPLVRILLRTALGLLVAALYLHIGTARAGLGNPLFSEVPADKGFFSGTNGIITAFAEDAHGFIWFGTQAGLIRYDGYKYKRYDHDPDNPSSLGGRYVRTIFRATDGRLWVGSNSNGIWIFDPATERFTKLLSKQGKFASLAKARVQTIIADGRGGVWIGSDVGLYRQLAGETELTRFGNAFGGAGDLNDQRIRSLLLDREGTLWVGTLRGLNRLNPNEVRFQNVFSDKGNNKRVAEEEIWALLESHDSRIWWGGRTLGAGWVEPESGEVHLLGNGGKNPSAPWISAIVQPYPTEIWLATYGGGINVVDVASRTIVKRYRHDPALDDSLGMDTIGSLYLDRSGLLWVGTWGAGISRLDTSNRAFRVLRHSPNQNSSLSYPNVFSVMERSNGEIWVGTHGNGIDILNASGRMINSYRPAPDDSTALADGAILALTESSDGTVWVGTRQGGLHRFDPHTGQFHRYTKDDGLVHPQINRLLVGDNGLVWIATGGGLTRFDPRTELFERFALANTPDTWFSREVHPLAQTADGTIWAGTDNGLFALSPGESKLVSLASSAGISGDDINGLALDPQGQLWIATDKGVDRIVSWDGRNALVQSVNRQLKNEPPSPRLTANLVPDRLGRMWDVSGMIDLHSWTYHGFNPSDGSDIRGGWVGAYATMQNGNLLFGGPTGLLVIDPEAFEPWNYQPPIVPTNLRIDGKIHPYVAEKGVVLSDTVKSFSVEYAALDYSAPNVLSYSHRLQGYDEFWVDTAADRRTATYTNLDPGNYVLQVRGSNRHGQMSNNALALNIVVLPALYETLWFRILMVFLVAGTLYLAYLARVRTLKAREQLLQLLVRERTAELEQANSNLELSSKTDFLTSLPNRRAFIEIGQREIEHYARNQRTFCILLADIDHFKHFNDRYGHDAGDCVLVAVADTFRKTVRAQDNLARWGGEEFIFLLPETQLAGGIELADRIRRSVAARDIKFGDNKFSVTLTLGVAEFTEGTLNDSVKQADLALYRGKKKGRNRVETG